MMGEEFCKSFFIAFDKQSKKVNDKIKRKVQVVSVEQVFDRLAMCRKHVLPKFTVVGKPVDLP